MAEQYARPEAINASVLASLGKVVEMKTFKTNVPSADEEIQRATQQVPLKIICVGDYTGGVNRKEVFIKDYLGISPAFRSQPLNCVDFYLTTAKWRRPSALNACHSIVLQFCEVSNMDRLSAMAEVFFRYSQGALVFWSPQNDSSLGSALKWRTTIKEEVFSSIPCVLVADNVPQSRVEPLKWIGPQRVFENQALLDQFCQDHEFVESFEITSRDWKSGEKSVFGQAVNCLLDNILQSEEMEAKDWM